MSLCRGKSNTWYKHKENNNIGLLIWLFLSLFFWYQIKNQKSVLFIFSKTDYNYLRVPTMVDARVENCSTALWNQCCFMARNATEWQPTAWKRSMPSTVDGKSAASSGMRRSQIKTCTGWPVFCQLFQWQSLRWWSLGSLFSSKSNLVSRFVPVIDNTGLQVCAITHISW